MATPLEEQVLKVLCDAREPLTADQLLERLPAEVKAAKPKPRPPPSRSAAQAMCCGSLRSSTAARTFGLPLCAPSGRLSDDAGGKAVRMGVTPFIPSRNRMW